MTSRLTRLPRSTSFKDNSREQVGFYQGIFGGDSMIATFIEHGQASAG